MFVFAQHEPVFQFHVIVEGMSDEESKQDWLQRTILLVGASEYAAKLADDDDPRKGYWHMVTVKGRHCRRTMLPLSEATSGKEWSGLTA